MIYKSVTFTFLAIALQACSTTAPTTSGPNVGVASVTGGTAYTGTVSVITNGTTVTLPAKNATWGATAQPSYTSATTVAGARQSTYALAVAGRQNGTYFAGVVGVLAGPPAAPTATFSGEYYVVDSTGATSGGFALTANFVTNTITGTSTSGANPVSATGTITGSDISGTVTYKGNTGNWAGGFYDPNVSSLTTELSSAFVGNNVAGIIYGVN